MTNILALDEILGLPAHPLVVHAAVVLVPLAALGVVVTAFWPKARRTLAWIVVGLAAVGFVSAFLAQQSGEALEERVDRGELVEEHAELGDSGLAAAGAVLVGALGVAGLDTYERRARKRLARKQAEPSWWKPATIGVGVVAIALSVLGTAQIYRIGHSGAKATWEDVGSGEGDSGEGGEGGEESGLPAPVVTARGTSG